jgi:hypothetical protein
MFPPPPCAGELFCGGGTKPGDAGAGAVDTVSLPEPLQVGQAKETIPLPKQ